MATRSDSRMRLHQCAQPLNSAMRAREIDSYRIMCIILTLAERQGGITISALESDTLTIADPNETVETTVDQAFGKLRMVLSKFGALAQQAQPDSKTRYPYAFNTILHHCDLEALFAYCGVRQPRMDYTVRMNNEFGNFQITVMPTR